MADKKRKKRNAVSASEAPSQLMRTIKSFNWGLFGLFLLTFLIVSVLYRVGMFYEWYPTIPIYFALTLCSGLVYAFYNRGLMGRLPKAEELNESWTDEQKQTFLAEAAARKKKSRFLLILFAALLLTFFFDALLALLDSAGMDVSF